MNTRKRTAEEYRFRYWRRSLRTQGFNLDRGSWARYILTGQLKVHSSTPGRHLRGGVYHKALPEVIAALRAV